MVAKFEPRHRWVYYPNMTRDEVRMLVHFLPRHSCDHTNRTSPCAAQVMVFLTFDSADGDELIPTM